MGEGRFVGIRGIDPNLIVTTINGVNVPAPENDKRSVALDVIPSELLSALEVSKSITPDMDGDGIGGAVNTRSASAFDGPGRSFRFAAQSSFNQLQGENSPRASLEYSDNLDLGNQPQSLGVAASMSWFDRNFGSENIETDGGWFDDLERTDDIQFKGAKEIEQRDYVVNRERLGLAANFDYRSGGGGEWYLRTLFSSFSDQEYRTRNEFKFDKGDAVEGGEGFATWDGATLEKELKDRYEEQEILSLSAGGSQSFDRWTLNYRAGYSKAKEAEPDRRDTEFKAKNVQIGYSSHGARPALFADPATLDPEAYEVSEIVVEDNFTDDTERSVKFDLKRDFDTANMHGYLEFGAKLRRREKSNDIGIRVFDGFPDDPSLERFALPGAAYGQGRSGLGVSEHAIDRYIADNLRSFELNADDTLAASTGGDYLMDEDVDALYVKNRLDIDSLRIVYGVRYERTAFDASGLRVIFDDLGAAGSPAPTPVSFADSYASALPSVNVRYAVNDRLLLRAAFYQTMARPKFGDLAPGGEVEFEEDDGENVLKAEIGNPTSTPCARLALAQKSERLLGLEELDDPAFDVYRDAHAQVDLGLKFHVTPRWEINLDANNLTDEPYYAYFGDRRYNAQYETYGRTVALGLRYQP